MRGGGKREEGEGGEKEMLFARQSDVVLSDLFSVAGSFVYLTVLQV